MIQVSDTWRRLYAIEEHTEEFYVNVSGEDYYKDSIQDISIEWPLFSELSVGNTCSAQLNLEFYPRVEPPEMAKIIVYVRLVYNGETSEWLQRGVFYTDVRSSDPWGLLSITAYDSMLKLEQMFDPEVDLRIWPNLFSEVVKAISAKTGIEIDERTVYQDYSMDYPLEYSCRELLGYIAAANAGNWIITNEDKLLFIPLGNIPPETSYLITEIGEAILMGEVRLIV